MKTKTGEMTRLLHPRSRAEKRATCCVSAPGGWLSGKGAQNFTPDDPGRGEIRSTKAP
ncbi:MAG: hypothetical protein WA996_10365 [Candidatus Promineifilaceae bacterium]